MRPRIYLLAAFSIVVMVALSACDKKQTPAPAEIAKVTEREWCGEHFVPESICTRCRPNLIAGFKQKGDWCKEHNLPDSQCLVCHPELKAKFEAMAPK